MYESKIKDLEEPLSGSDIEIKLAEYAESVLEKSSTLPETNIATFLNNKLEGTAYLSSRGAARKIAALSSDFVEYYKDMEGLQSQNTNRCRFEKILNGKRINFLEICQLAMFLGISADKLKKRKLSVGEYSKEVDKRVIELLKDGIGINKAAKRLGVSSKTIRDIRDGRFSIKINQLVVMAVEKDLIGIRLIRKLYHR